MLPEIWEDDPLLLWPVVAGRGSVLSTVTFIAD